MKVRKRCYIRGLTALGLFNTFCGCLFNIVLVKVCDSDTGKIVCWYFDRADKHPQIKEEIEEVE